MRLTCGRRVALLCVSLVAAAPPSSLASVNCATATTSRKHFVIYAVATRAQYVNYQDGITRAQGHNPFDADPRNRRIKRALGLATRHFLLSGCTQARC